MWYAALAGVVGFVALMMVTVLAGDGSPSTTASSASSSSSAASPVTAEFQVSPTLAPPAGSELASVTRIVDGDTLEIKMLSGETATVRLIGINTPESGECLSEQSTVVLGTLLSDEVVTMTADMSDRDQ